MPTTTRERAATAAAASSSSSSSSSSARACLEHLVRALNQLGVGLGAAPSAGGGGRSEDARGRPSRTSSSKADRTRGALTSELLRRAKFGHASATSALWRALHDLALVAVAGFPDPEVAARAIARARCDGKDGGEASSSDLRGDGDGEDARDARREAKEDLECATLARVYLRAHAYPHVDELDDVEPVAEMTDAALAKKKKKKKKKTRTLANRDAESDKGSRALLFALAWLTRTLDVFARAHADAAAQTLRLSPPSPRTPLPPYPSSDAARAEAAAIAAEEEEVRETASQTASHTTAFAW